MSNFPTTPHINVQNKDLIIEAANTSYTNA